MPGSNRIPVVISLLAVLTVLLIPGSVFSQDSELIKKVAVLPYTVNAEDDLAYLKDSLPELLADRLSESGVVLADPAEVEDILATQFAGKVTEESARKIAVLTGSTHALYGNFNQIGESLILDSRLVEAFGLDPAQTLYVEKNGIINLLPAFDDLVAQVQKNLLDQQNIVAFGVEGTQILDKEVVLMRIRMNKGDPYDPKMVNEDLKGIYELGYFDDVKVVVSDVTGGKKVTYHVVEKPRIQAVSVLGSDEFSEDDILEAINTKMGAVLNPRVLKDDLETVRGMYRKDGYFKSTVTHEIEDAGSGQARLNIIVEEGPKLYVEEIKFQGVERVDEDDLRDVLALKELGFIEVLTAGGVFNEEALERDVAAISSFYHNRGFIYAKVGKPEVDIEDDGIYVTFQINEGPRFKVTGISYEGDLIDSEATLNGVIQADELLEAEEYMNAEIIREDLKRLKSHYNNLGYAYAESDVRLADDEENETVEIVYILSKHQKVHIRRVMIEGNTKTRDNVILRELRLADGDMFSGAKLNRSTQRLNALNYFSDVSIEPVPTGDPDEMDLKVTVKEKATGSLSGGIGYASDQGVFLGASVGERNLFGKGYVLNLTGKFGSKTTMFNLGFQNPHVNDTDWGFGTNIYHKVEDLQSYHKQSLGGNVSVAHPLGEYTTATAQYGVSRYRVYDVDNDATDSIKDAEGWHLGDSLSGAITRNTLDDQSFPTTGSLNKFTLSWGSPLLSDSATDYLKYVFETENFYPLFWKVVFRARAEIGYMHSGWKGGSSSIEAFYLGGVGTVRGYDSRKISAFDDEGEKVGGNKMLVGTLELRVPIHEEMGITGLVFFDAGNVWKTGDIFFDSTGQPKDGTKPSGGLWKSVGAGLGWKSPMGPIMIQYGYALDDIDGGSKGKFEFSMGQTF